jgi:hypothetical protein
MQPPVPFGKMRRCRWVEPVSQFEWCSLYGKHLDGVPLHEVRAAEAGGAYVSQSTFACCSSVVHLCATGPTKIGRARYLAMFHAVPHCLINSFRFLGFLLWFVLRPGALREALGGPGKAHAPSLGQRRVLQEPGDFGTLGSLGWPEALLPSLCLSVKPGWTSACAV